MENTNLTENTTTSVVDTQVESKPKKSTFPLLLVVGLVLIIGIGFFFFLILTNKDTGIKLIDDSITSIETMFNQTNDIEEELVDLPDEFLEEELTSEDDIDESIEDIDTQLDQLDGLEEDFELDATDVGLE